MRRYISFRIDIILITIGLSLTVQCSPKKSSDDTPKVPDAQEVNPPIEVSEDKSSLAKYYALEHLKEWYPERILPPLFDYTMDLTSKSVIDLWLLRNEIFARNGYLFDDAVLRGYFRQFKWYQPIFDVPDFKVQLTKQEQDFVNKVLKLERELPADRYVRSGGYQMINVDHIYNQSQFKEVPAELIKMLADKNFAVVPGQHEQLFHVYDKNHYEYIPNFITTDLYLQVLHKHFSSILQKIEENKFTPLLTDLLKDAYLQSLQFEKEAQDEMLKRASQWSTTYLAIGYSLITDKMQKVSPEMDAIYKSEARKIVKADGTGSDFLKTDLLQYSQFKPRGNYTKTKELGYYFRCVKWLNTAPIYLDNDERLLSAVLIASFIRRSPRLLQSFQTFQEALKFIVGDEDTISLAHLISILSAEEANNPALLNDPQKLKVLREKLLALKIDKIKPKGGDQSTSDELNKPVLLFTAGRYTFDAEILSRLIHVTNPEPKRPFPKGLDVFAAFGDREAENILINEYKEGQQWKAYPDSLAKLKAQFNAPRDWDRNIYCKTFDAINALQSTDSRYPLFMKTPFWQRKNLITSLAAWSELKHDMLLYAERPYAAQAGEGGGPPPPQHVSYVEPNVPFWKKALALIKLQEQTLSKMNLLEDKTQEINRELKEIGDLLLTVSEKELANENVSKEEMDKLDWLGGQLEYLTFRIFDSDHLPEKERLIALVADVYEYNGTCLEEAVGLVDEIYVLAEINGRPYLTKGAMFSYYEFNSAQPLTDEEWQTQLISGSGKTPARPSWTEGITIRTRSLESKPGYSFLNN